MKELLMESTFVGVVLVIVATVVSKMFTEQKLPPKLRDWNKHHVMEKSLFISGFLIHILFEFGGINKWYCKHGRACKL
jgi:hypothetical protein